MTIQDFKSETFQEGDWEYQFISELCLHPDAMRNTWTPNIVHVFLGNVKTKEGAHLELFFKSQLQASHGDFEVRKDAEKIPPETKERILKHLGSELVKLWKGC